MIIKIINGQMQTNTYLIGDANGCYVVDPSDGYLKIKNKIEENFNNIVKGILLTHGHFDHIGSVDKIVEEYKCEVYMSKNDKYLVDGSLREYPNELRTFNTILNSLTIDAFLIKDKNIIVYETPGHTPGSVCYLFKNEKIMFTGDTVFKNSVGRCDLPGGSDASLRQSLSVLKQITGDLKLYCGHESDTTLLQEIMYNPYFRYL